QLLNGTLALATAAGFSVAGSLVDLSQPRAPGITAGAVLGWAALVPLYFVFRAYHHLGRAAESRWLCESSLCVFGAVVVLEVLGLATTKGLPGWARVVAWVGVADTYLGALAGVILLVLTLFFMLWFAGTKLLLRPRLGGLAVVAGLGELVILLALAGLVVSFTMTLAAAAGQTGVTEKALKRLTEGLVRDMTWWGIAAVLSWALLTALLFLDLW